MSPIHLSPHIAINLSPSPWLVVSGSPAVSNSFVSLYIDLFVSQSGWWCPALRLSPIHLSPFITIYLSPSLAGGVRLSGCLQFICLPVWLVVSGCPDVSNSFVSPYSNSFVSQSGWWCPALRMSPIQLSPLIAIHFSQSGWWCPALRMSPIHLSPLIAIHLSPSLAGGVRLSGCLQLICLRLEQYICLPVWLVVSGSPDVSNSFVSPYSNSFVSQWLVVSGSPAVSNSFVSPYSNSFVSQSGWWCPALRMSPIHLFPLIATHLSPSLAGGVRLSGCLQLICFPF